MMRRRLHTLVALLTLAATFTTLSAQQMMVNITRKQNPLPPQASIYYENPGRFFNISVSNTDTQAPIPIRFEISLVGPIEGGADVWPTSCDSYLTMSCNHSIPAGFIIQPKQTRYFSSIELNQHMKSYPEGTKEVSGAMAAAFLDAENGRPFGLVDEGHYGIRVTAKSNYDGDAGDVLGEAQCFFDVCYSATAPEFTFPSTEGFDFNADYDVVNFPTDYAHFEWTSPKFNVASLATARQFSYEFKLYHMLANQSPEEAIASDRIAFQQPGLMVPFCNIPQNVVGNLQRSGSQYFVAQVIAKAVISDINNPDYTLINNNGASQFMVLKLSQDGGSGGFENDLAVDDDEDASELPVTVTIEPKFKELTNELAPYFETPAKLFRVTLENTSNEDLTVSMLLQFFKDNWGVCPSPNKQHSTRSLTLLAGQSITLSDDQLNQLAGDYAYSDVIAFKAQTGFIIGKPAQNTFPGTDYTVSARVCKHTGKPVLREEVVGKARADFKTSGSVEAGDVFRITYEPRMSPLPVDDGIYFTKPSRLFTAKIENLSTLNYEVLPRLLFQDKEGDIYGGAGAHERLDQALKIGAGETVTLSGDQLDKLCGNFTKAIKITDNAPVPADTVEIEAAMGFLGLDGAALSEISLFDATVLRELYGKDEEAGEKAFLQAEVIEFETSLSAFLGDIDVSISAKQSEMPANTSAYFKKTYDLFDVELTNHSDKDYQATLNLKYRISEDNEIYIACVPGWHERTITLKAGDTYKLTKADHEKFFSSNRVVVCTPDGEGGNVPSDTIELYSSINSFLDSNIKLEDLSKAHLDVYSTPQLKTIKETNFGLLRPALIGQGDCDYSIKEGYYMHDVTVRINPLYDPMPGNGDAYISKTGNLYEIELVNTTDASIKGFPIIRYTFKDKEYNYAPAIQDVYKDYITLKPGDGTHALTMKEIERYLCGKKGVRYPKSGDAAPDTLDTFEGLLDLEAENIVGIAIIDIDSINKYNKETTPDFEARTIRGFGSHTFKADPDVILDDVIVKVSSILDRLPGNGDPYVKSPGRIFKIELTNTLDRAVKIKPSFYYNFTDKAGETYEPYYANREDADSVITLAAKATRELTTSEVNYFCGGTVLLHELVDQEVPDTMRAFTNLVRCTEDDKAVFMALDAEKLDEVDADDPDFLDKVRLGTGRHSFRGVEGLNLEEVTIYLKHRMEPMPANGLYYAKTPGRLFEVKLVNNSQEELFVLPVFEYQFDDNDSYHAIDFRHRVDKPIQLGPEEERVLSAEEINELCGGADKLCYYANSKTAICDTIKDLRNLASEKILNKARLVAYRATMLEVAYEDPKVQPLFDEDASAASLAEATLEYMEYISLATLGKETTQFEASKDVVLGDIEVKISPKDKMSEEAEPYFSEPGKYFDITLSNVGIEESTFGLRLTLNNKYYGVTDSTFTLPPDSTITLSEEQVNNLCGGIKAEKIYQLDTLDNVITRKVAKDMKLLDGGNSVQALAWNLPPKKTLSANGDNVDTLAVGSSDFVTKFREIKVGEFILTASEIKANESIDSCYSGKGYITWNAMGFPIKIAVEFDTLYVNKESVAYRGLVKSAKKEELLNFAPFDLFENKIDSLGLGEELGTEVKNMLAGSDFATYYTYVTETMEAIPMTFVEGSPALQLPVKLPESVSKKSPVDIQLLSMEFRPDRASMNLIGEFMLPENNYVGTAENILVLGCPQLGMSDSTLIPKTGNLALLTDLTVKDPSTGFNITFLAPSSTNLEEGSVELDNNGCFVEWEDGEFAGFVVDAKMAIPSSDIVKVVDGEVQDSIAPDIRLTVTIEDREDWIGQVRFDAFEHVDAPGYTFTAGGGEVGVVYDHSKTKAPDGMTLDAFPEGYDWTKVSSISKNASDDKKLKEWQGFYFQKLAVGFPSFVEIDNSGEDKRLSIAAEKIIYDESGFSMTLAAHNVVDKSTASMGGWRITLDEVYLSVLQSHFGNFGFNGKFDVPLLDGQIGYDAKVFYADKNAATPPVGGQSGDEQSTPAKEKSMKIVFETRQVDSLSIDFFVGTMDFEKENTYFNLTYFDDTTTVELCLSGEINIAGSKSAESAVGFALPGISFHKMRVANFVSKEEIQGNAYHFETSDQSFCFDLGRWSLGGVTLGGGGGTGGSGNNEQANNSGSGGSGNGSGNSNSGNNNNGNSNSDSGNSNGSGESEDDEHKIDSEVEYGLNIAGFAIGLEEFSIATRSQGEDTHIGLYINAKMSLMEMISASAGFTIWASFDMETKNADYVETTFNDVSVEASMAGMYLKGVLKVDNNDTYGDGYAGMLEITLPGDLFRLNAEGGYYRKLQNDTEASNYGKKYSWGYLNVAVGSKALSSMQPVGISEIAGGFYFNCRTTGKEDSNGMQEVEPSYGMIGAMLGVGLTVGDEGAVAGYFDMLFFYDMEADRLSKIQFTGTAHIIGGGTHKEGAINANTLIIYENTIDNVKKTGRKYLQLTITVDAVANMTEMAQKMIANYVPVELDGAMAGLEGAFGQDDQDRSDAGAERSEDSDSDAKSQLKASAGVSLNLDFLVEFISPSNPDEIKWHLWLGKPQPESERCQVTFIDFQLGDKDDAVAAWAKVWVNAYFCIGNDLPLGSDGSILPPIPQEVQEFLDGTDMQGNSQSLTSTANQKRNDAMNKLLQGGVDGGLLFGAAAGAKFGANMLIAYFDVTMLGGFDIALVKLAGEGTKCANNGRTMRGINGYYATGQAYALLKGEIGLMIDLWIFSGKIALVEAGLGAMLQVGFAHPTWFYGKARARCVLFEGLVKFNKAIEIEAGDICVPYYANPLADIEIFGDTYPNYDNKEDGWEADKKISPYAIPRFTTNMAIGTEIRLLDETQNAILEAEGYDTSGEGAQNAERTYRFLLNTNQLVEEYAQPTSSLTQSYYVGTTNSSGDRTNYTLNLGALKPDTCYKVTLLGYAQEKVDGVWGNPRFCDEESNYKNVRRPWRDTCEFYFRTEELPPYLTDNDIAIAPGNFKLKGGPAYYRDLQRPWIAMKRSRSSLFKTGYDMKVRIERGQYSGKNLKWMLVDEAPIKEYVESDAQGKFITWKATENLDISVLKNKYYHTRLRIVRINRTKYNQYMKAATEKFVKETIQYEKAQTRDQILGKGVSASSSTVRTLAGTSTSSTSRTLSGRATTTLRPVTSTQSSQEETINLADIFEGFENQMVTERQKDEIERKVKEFEQSVNMDDFTEIIYEYPLSYYEYESMNAHLTALKAAGTIQDKAPSHLDALLVDITDQYGKQADNNYLFSSLPFTTPATTFAYWSSYAFFPGYTMNQYDYDKVVSKVTSSQSATLNMSSVYNQYAQSPSFSGDWLYGSIFDSFFRGINPFLIGEVEKDGVEFLGSPSTYYQFNAWKDKMKPRTYSSDVLSYTRYYYPEFKGAYAWYREYMETQAFMVQELTEDIKYVAEKFETAAVKKRTSTKVEVDAGKARQWSQSWHNQTMLTGWSGNQVSFKAYQIPYVYALANYKVSKSDDPYYLARSVYDPLKVIDRMFKPFDAKTYLQKTVTSMTFKFVRPTGYNINNNDGTSDTGLVVRKADMSSNTYTYKISYPFKNYTFKYL